MNSKLGINTISLRTNIPSEFVTVFIALL